MQQPNDYPYIEEGRIAYELVLTMGHRNAFAHATKRAQEAMAAGNSDEQRFWQFVVNSLTPC
jgi:hypothetical protein